ncbi:maltooligosyl trehalose synthase [Candidatus Magnetoovum chiemensis]|nr:maltooligosyl trehalose synthase [Candidatus Magnetoovum chiemensis]
MQLNPSFGFKEAKNIIKYLADLGISDIYASPIFKAKKGSSHCYDVVDPDQINPELGTEDDFYKLSKEVQSYDMGWLQDIVPNHMGFNGENNFLMDVLENGENSLYYEFFDIDWQHPYESIKGRVLAPFLGRLYWESLENGEIQLKYDESGFNVNYYEHKFPLRIETYGDILTTGLNRLMTSLNEDGPEYIKLSGILYTLKSLPHRSENAQERQAAIQFIKRLLWELYSRKPVIKKFIDGNLKLFNATKNNPESFDRLDELLKQQNFRLSFWKIASEEINYRRFFNINELISIRVEDENVFYYTHSLIFDLIKKGMFTGIRIDHIDGLYDPSEYLNRLKSIAPNIYIAVEKILELEEELPSWNIHGTVGYDFLNYVNGIFCDTNNSQHITRAYTSFTGLNPSYEKLFYENKRKIIDRYMLGDIDNIIRLIKTVSSNDRQGNDISIHGFKDALIEVFVTFPVYRTYINYNDYSDEDQKYIKKAITKAKQKNPALLYELNYLDRFFSSEFRDQLPEDKLNAWLNLIMKFQQFTGPLMAKGLEDTLFYVYNRLISLNEVGGNPHKFGITTQEFHAFNQKRCDTWPNTMNTTSTHDTKRGEDVRARINVLSELIQEWRINLRNWHRMNKRYQRTVDSALVPSLNDEYFLYQTLLGLWPFEEQEDSNIEPRLKNYTIKAVREAKIQTGWLKPDIEYEDAYTAFIEDILKPDENNNFIKSFLTFQKKIAFYGMFNSLSQTLLKITSPGIADFYQGTELWELNLVDPDNRTPVDFQKRKYYLKDIIEKEKKDLPSLISELIETKEDGRIKMFLIYKSLQTRKKYAELFKGGKYMPMKTGGKYKDNIISFARTKNTRSLLTIAPRFLTRIVSEGQMPLGKEIWDDTHIILPDNTPKTWTNALDGSIIESADKLEISSVFNLFPLALLINYD